MNIVWWVSAAGLWLLVIAEGIVLLATLRSVASIHLALDQFMARGTPDFGSVGIGPEPGTHLSKLKPW